MAIQQSIYEDGEQWGITLSNNGDNSYSINIDHHKEKSIHVSVKAVEYPLTRLQFEIFEKFLFAKYFKMAEENREYKKVFDGLAGLVMKHADIYQPVKEHNGPWKQF